MPTFIFRPSAAGLSSQTFLDLSPVVQYSVGLHISITFNYLLVTTTWMGGCLQIAKPSRYITNSYVNSAFPLSGVHKTSIGLSGGARLPVSAVIAHGR